MWPSIKYCWLITVYVGKINITELVRYYNLNSFLLLFFFFLFTKYFSIACNFFLFSFRNNKLWHVWFEAFCCSDCAVHPVFHISPIIIILVNASVVSVLRSFIFSKDKKWRNQPASFLNSVKIMHLAIPFSLLVEYVLPISSLFVLWSFVQESS